MKILLFPFLLFFSLNLFGQKRTQEVIEAGSIKYVRLNADEIYKITIRTAPVDFIKITTKAHGEYFNEIALDSRVEQHTLVLNSRFRDELQNGFDKLSAHKVFAIEVELEIPEGMNLEVVSNLASVYVEGTFDAVLIELKTGSCFLQPFQGDAVVNTFSGNIFLSTANAIVKAESRHGTVDRPEHLSGKNEVLLTSINGNIKVQETK